jgi:MFS family permease
MRFSPFGNPLYLLITLSSLNHCAFVGTRFALTLYSVHLEASPAVVGAISAACGVFGMVTGVAAGKWVDRVGARWPMVLTSVGIAVSALLCLVSPQLAALFVVSGLLGAAYNTYFVSQQPLLGRYGSSEDRVRNFSLAGLGMSIASFVAPVMVGKTIDSLGYEPAFLILGVLPVLPALLFAANRVPMPRAQVAASPAGAAPTGGVSLRSDRNLRTIFVFSATILATWQTVLFLLPLYGLAIGLSAFQIGLVMGGLALAAMLSRLVAPWLVRRFMAWPVLIVSLGSSVLGLVLLPFLDGLLPLGIAAFWFGFGLGICNPMAQALLYDASPPGRAGEVLGVWTMLANAAQTLVPLGTGAASATLGMAPVFWLLAGAVMLCCYAGRSRLRPGSG